jgi:hypothetical protein
MHFSFPCYIPSPLYPLSFNLRNSYECHRPESELQHHHCSLYL